MKQLVLFLEERSAKAALEGLLPRLLPAEIHIRYIVFEGKSDLEKQIDRRLRGWIYPETAFVILRDQDLEDCRERKRTRVGKCVAAGKPSTIVRIACRELESWYFGQLGAVEEALQVNQLRKYSDKSKYRIPDSIQKPSIELKEITGGKYQKVSGSREIGKYLSVEEKRNSSESYNHFISGVKKAIESLC